MGHIIGFVSVKGGVGKTTISLETASALANHLDKRVLLVDCNFSAPNVHLYLGLEPGLTLHDVLAEDNGYGLHKAIYEKYGFDIIPASLYYRDDVDFFKLKRALSRLKNRYDFIILDSSPNYKEMIPVIAAAEKIFVITTPDIPTLTTSLKSAVIALRKKTPVYGIIINRIRNPRYELELEDVEELGGIPVVAKIRDDKKMAESLYYKKPLVLHKENNKISKEVRNFAEVLCGSPEKPKGILDRWMPWRRKFNKEKVNRELMRSLFY